MRALAVTGIEAVAAAMRSAAEKPATTVEATDDCFLLLSTFLSMLVKFLPLNSTSFDMMMLMMRCGRHATSLSKHASRCESDQAGGRRAPQLARPNTAKSVFTVRRS